MRYVNKLLNSECNEKAYGITIVFIFYYFYFGNNFSGKNTGSKVSSDMLLDPKLRSGGTLNVSQFEILKPFPKSLEKLPEIWRKKTVILPRFRNRF